MEGNDRLYSALLTDLYELTMADSYLREGMFGRATFTLYVRSLPEHRGYLVFAGLEDALRHLEAMRFTAEDLAYLESLRLFSPQLLEYLQRFRFQGEVRAIPEGRLCFAGEPLVEITAPVIEAQLVESAVMNAIHYQTVLATKAARCVYAAQGRPVIDFALRRTPGVEASLRLARACAMVGFMATSNVLAGKRYGFAVAGTMAHSYILTFPSEIEAFRAFVRAFPEQAVLLIDTYDTLAGAEHAIQVGRELAEAGRQLRAVRLDSGDMVELSKRVRAMLDAAGLRQTRILASGGFDEFEIARVLEAGAPIDSFGVGTRLGVSADAPYLDMAYKLSAYEGRPVRKLSTGKATLAGEKQVWRCLDERGQFAGDIITRRDEPPPEPGAEPLLVCVMRDGRAVEPYPSLETLRSRFQADFARLDSRYKRILDPEHYPVSLSRALEELQAAAPRA
jgi:nicotinate phosphoribosyltransferase